MPRVDGAGRGDELLLADGEARQDGAAAQLEADVVEDLLAGPHHGAVAQQAEAGRLVAEEQVGGDAEVRAEHHLLVHGIDAERDRLVRRGERDRPALPQDLARRALVHARQRS